MVLCRELPGVLHYKAWRDHSSDYPVFSRAGNSLRMSKNLVTDSDKKIHDKLQLLLLY